MTPASLALPATDTSTLAGEHALLMRDVERRARPVLALLAVRVWPYAELGGLVALLRSTVLRQVSDEETSLFPHDASAPPFAELSADHVRLHAVTRQLESARLRPGAGAQLRALVEELLRVLSRHLVAEQAVLSALPNVDTPVPSAASLVAGSGYWLPADDEPIRVELDALPAAEAVELGVERVLRLKPGQTAELCAGDGLRLLAVRRWIYLFDAERFGVESGSAGAGHTVRITCRADSAAVSIGCPG